MMEYKCKRLTIVFLNFFLVCFLPHGPSICRADRYFTLFHDSNNNNDTIISRVQHNSVSILSNFFDGPASQAVWRKYTFVDSNLCSSYQSDFKSVSNFVSIYPDDVDANCVLGSLLVYCYRFDEAKNFFLRSAIASNWTYLPSILNLAEIFMFENDIDSAEDILYSGLQSLKNSSVSALLYYNLGSLYERNMMYNTAADWYLVSALKNMRKISYWVKASTILFPAIHRDYRYSENVLLAAIQRNPGSATLLNYMGVLMELTQRPVLAIPFYTEAIRIERGIHIEAICNLAHVYLSLNDYGNFSLYLSQCLQQSDPASLGPILDIIALLIRNKHIYEAMVVVRRVLVVRYPSNVPLLVTLTPLCTDHTFESVEDTFKPLRYFCIHAIIREYVLRGQWDDVQAATEKMGKPTDKIHLVWWLFVRGLAQMFR